MDVENKHQLSICLCHLAFLCGHPESSALPEAEHDGIPAPLEVLGVDNYPTRSVDRNKPATLRGIDFFSLDSSHRKSDRATSWVRCLSCSLLFGLPPA